MDRRTKYTKMILRQSLLELMKKNDINKITVKELCETADVNRGTFYSYYSDQYDLLQKIEEELFETVKQTLAKNKNPQNSVLEIIQGINENRDICRILFSPHGDDAFLKKIVYIAQNSCIEDWGNKIKNPDENLLEYLYTFAANGSVGIIQQWINGGMKQSPKEIAQVIERSTYQGLSGFFTQKL